MDTTESLVTFADARQYIPGRPHVSQVYRWAMRGLRGVRLEWVQVGGRRFTSREAIDRFISAMTAAAKGEALPPPAASTAARRKRDAQDTRELAGAGYAVGT